MQPQRPLYRHSGHYLEPQHFQQADACAACGRTAVLEAVRPCFWGVGELDIDEAALAEGRIAVRSARLRFRDGTEAVIAAEPEAGNAILPERRFDAAWTDRNTPLTVCVGLPASRASGNVAGIAPIRGDAGELPEGPGRHLSPGDDRLPDRYAPPHAAESLSDAPVRTPYLYPRLFWEAETADRPDRLFLPLLRLTDDGTGPRPDSAFAPPRRGRRRRAPRPCAKTGGTPHRPHAADRAPARVRRRGHAGAPAAYGGGPHALGPAPPADVAGGLAVGRLRPAAGRHRGDGGLHVRPPAGRPAPLPPRRSGGEFPGPCAAAGERNARAVPRTRGLDPLPSRKRLPVRRPAGAPRRRGPPSGAAIRRARSLVESGRLVADALPDLPRTLAQAVSGGPLREIFAPPGLPCRQDIRYLEIDTRSKH